MPEIKNQFTGGKMNKDLDERLIPKGEYRDAMNVQVATSEGSDVGTVGNILGNKKITGVEFGPNATVVASIADEKVDTLYYFVYDVFVNYILSYKRGEPKVNFVFVDAKADTPQAVLKFHPSRLITGINIVDDMLFWTDNVSEPKKISISRSIQGTSDLGLTHTRFINEGQFPASVTPPDIEEKHITVIKKGPSTPLGLQLGTSRVPGKIYTGVIDSLSGTDYVLGGGGTLDTNGIPINPSSFRGEGGNAGSRYNFNGITTKEGSNTFNISITSALDSNGSLIQDPDFGPINTLTGLTGWHKAVSLGDPDYSAGIYNNIEIGTKIVFKSFDGNNPPATPITDFSIKGVVQDYWVHGVGGVTISGIDNVNTTTSTIKVKVLSIDGFIPTDTNKFAVDLFDDDEKLFEFKFPRFSYRYKYEDGEYSTFAPWTSVAFKPGAFDYHPRKGYNLGMTNRINKIKLFGLVNDSTPIDVVSIDLLFKDETSPNIYVVDTIRPDDNATTLVGGAYLNKWKSLVLDPSVPFVIDRETISSVVPSNQLLRPWDNVPRRALAQDITGNRIVYGNYVQNYDLVVDTGGKYVPSFLVTCEEFNPIEISPSGVLSQGNNSGSGKSIKSLREYQLGVVFVDKYGRETPVISNDTGTIKLKKDRADKFNRLTVSLTAGSKFPRHEDFKYFKFYVKETSGEYYNMAMDRWYDAEDGNIWLAFPSSDRNKIDIDAFLILKKGSNEEVLVKDTARYKIIAIENDAPNFIKTKKRLTLSIIHEFNGVKNLYDDFIGESPVIGVDYFEMNYKAFLNSSGRHLDKYTDGTLYIEWEDLGTKQISDRYEIATITHDWEAEETGTTPNPTLDEAKYYVQLARNIGSDANFITDDISGKNPSKIRNGIKTNIYKYTTENKPQFEGRFFVKIYEDEVFQANIGKTYSGDFDYRILESKKVYYMKPEHKYIHTKMLGHYMTNGPVTMWDGTTPLHPQELLDFEPADATTGYNAWEGGTSATAQQYGYYAIDEFTAMASFFRRYSIKNQELFIPNSPGSPTGTVLTRPAVAHLRRGTNNEDFNKSGWQNYTVGKFDSTYLDEKWTPVSKWNDEFGVRVHTGTLSGVARISNRGYTNYWQYGVWSETSPEIIYNNPVLGTTVLGGDLLKTFSWGRETVQTGADNARDTEVWFIDGGPYAGSAYDYYGKGDFTWSDMGRFEQFPGGPLVDPGTSNYNVMSNFASNIWAQAGNDNVSTATDNVMWSSGIIDKPSMGKHTMNLAFGGIKGAATSNTSAGFLNIGNWEPGNPTLNSTYANEERFVRNLNSGYQFRWRQDPNKTIYTIGGSVESSGYLRHSTNRNDSIALANKGIFNDGQSGTHELGYTAAGEEPYTQLEMETFSGIDGINNYGATSMAELLSFNFTKNWKFGDISPSYNNKWNPLTVGKMDNCLEITLQVCNFDGSTTTMMGNITTSGYNASNPDLVPDDLVLFVKSIKGTSATFPDDTIVSVGMAFSNYTKHVVTSTPTFTGVAATVEALANFNTHDTLQDPYKNKFLVIRRIQALGTGGVLASSTVPTTHYALTLGGYTQPLRSGEHRLALENGAESFQPLRGSNITFVQVGMNGYSPNSEFNINTIAKNSTVEAARWGAITAVGYDLEFIEPIEPEEVLSENPAIFETEPKELPELDIYYEASPEIPMILDTDTIKVAFPIGTSVLTLSSIANMWAIKKWSVVGYMGDKLLISGKLSGSTPTYSNNISPGEITCFKADGLEFKTALLNVDDYNHTQLGPVGVLTINLILYSANYSLSWHNCFSFGNGVESNRIRDNFNLPYIINGVKASTTLEYEYKEEHRKYGLIYSGLYNTLSGVNNLNQFIQAEKITKDINPIYGSIQKLHARDADLVAFCEDKVLRILSQKDALYNADGNINLTATDRVLGQALPFTGEYGISTNPESFASENYRVYFSDKTRGTILRLSMDGLTPISDYGMKDWFRDNLKLSNRVIGSFDSRNDEYVLKLDYSPLPSPPNTSGIPDILTPGCKMAGAVNYNPLANVDDGSCVLESDSGSDGIQGCTDPLALNYNPAAVISSGLCIYIVYGCTDMTACNYPFMQATPTVDDGSCVYPLPNANCIGGCNAGYVMGPPWIYESYGIGTCTLIGDVVIGCTNPAATNYDPLATISDNSCLVAWQGCAGLFSGTTYTSDALTEAIPVYGLSNPSNGNIIFQNMENFQAIAVGDSFTMWSHNGDGVPITNVGGTDIYTVLSTQITYPNWNTPVLTINIEDYTNASWANYQVQTDPLVAVFDCGITTGCTDPVAVNYNPLANNNCAVGQIGMGCPCNYTGLVFGCTNPAAINYDPLATTDDGSCLIEASPPLGCAIGFIMINGICTWPIYGCMNTQAANYDSLANVDDYSCQTYGCTSGGCVGVNASATVPYGLYHSVPACQAACAYYSVDGCTDPTANNYDLNANTPCVVNSITNGCCTYDVDGCTDMTACNYNSAATVNNGSCTYPIANANCLGVCNSGYYIANPDSFGFGPCVLIPVIIYGCMDSTMFNYNPSATNDDGSCIPFIYGCMDSTANNYSGTYNTPCVEDSITNGCCTYDVYGCTDMTACNYPFMQTTPTIDDGSCIYPPPNADCLGGCLPGYYIANPDSFGLGPCVPVVNGCMDATACNYSIYANIDDGSCTYPTVPNTDCAGACLTGYISVNGVCVVMVGGCMDPIATNYIPTANVPCVGCCNYDGVFDPNCIVATTGFSSYQITGIPPLVSGRFLNWSNMTGATGYLVRWSGNYTFLYHTAVPMVTDSSYTIPTDQMVPGQTYYWQVAKVCSAGQSDWSTTKSFVAGGPYVG